MHRSNLKTIFLITGMKSVVMVITRQNSSLFVFINFFRKKYLVHWFLFFIFNIFKPVYLYSYLFFNQMINVQLRLSVMMKK